MLLVRADGSSPTHDACLEGLSGSTPAATLSGRFETAKSLVSRGRKAPKMGVHYISDGQHTG